MTTNELRRRHKALNKRQDALCLSFCFAAKVNVSKQSGELSLDQDGDTLMMGSVHSDHHCVISVFQETHRREILEVKQGVC